MALIRLTGGKEKTVTAEAGKSIWHVLNGELEPTKAQQKFAEKVDKIYLNWRKAPDSYLLKHKEVLTGIVKINWMCDYQGKPTKPEFDDKDCWRVSRVLGLVS